MNSYPANIKLVLVNVRIMKSFLRSLLIVFSVISSVGLLFVGVYLLVQRFKNKDILKVGSGIIKNIEDKIEEGIVNVVSESIKEEGLNSKSPRKNESSFKNENVLFQVNLDPAKVKSLKNRSSVAKVSKYSPTPRQKEILSYLKSLPNSKMSSISKAFSDVTPRTLRRDMAKLEQQGFLRQEGKTKDAIYKLVKFQ